MADINGTVTTEAPPFVPGYISSVNQLNALWIIINTIFILSMQTGEFLKNQNSKVSSYRNFQVI